MTEQRTLMSATLQFLIADFETQVESLLIWTALSRTALTLTSMDLTTFVLPTHLITSILLISSETLDFLSRRLAQTFLWDLFHTRGTFI